jgi:hypothetical protein
MRVFERKLPRRIFGPKKRNGPKRLKEKMA